MPAGSYGLIVEGGYDATVYDVIVRRVASHEVRVVTNPCEGKPNLKQKFPGLLEGLRYPELGGPVDTAIVIVDSDGKNSDEIETSLRAKVKGRHYPFAVHFYAVQQAMEAWLLADPQALSRVVQRRGGSAIASTRGDLQGLFRPKPFLRQLLSERGIDYTAAVAAEIASELNLEALSAACPRFQQFADLVDC